MPKVTPQQDCYTFKILSVFYVLREEILTEHLSATHICMIKPMQQFCIYD